MGIWDYMYSATDQLKRNAPDLTAVKHACRTTYDYSWWAATKVDTAVKRACRTTYDYSWSAVSKVDNAVRVNAVQKVKNDYLPDENTRSEIYRFTNCFAKNAARFTFHEGIKVVPGGSLIYKVGSQTFHDYSKSVDHKEEIKALRAEIGQLKKEKGGCVSLIEQAEKCKLAEESESRKALHSETNLNQKPEDVIRIFMMKEFMGRDFLDDLIVPQVKSRKNLK